MTTHPEQRAAAPSDHPAPPALRDGSGRVLEYLRLSVTDRCNFRCSYCLPNGCPKGDGEEPLSVPEIERLVRAFAALGFWKVRITGGEPTLRRDILEIVGRVASVPGVRHVGLTTNGSRLESLARDLARAGLTCLNVSLDTLDPVRFATITGWSRLERIVGGVEKAIAAGVHHVKVNAVLLAGTDAVELDRFLAWIEDLPVTVRFIELMQTGDAGEAFAQNYVPAAHMERLFAERGFTRVARAAGAGPSADFAHPRYRGRVGLIAPYAHEFCGSCNRLRVSSAGNLKLCLFAEEELPLRELLRADHGHDGHDALVARIREAVEAKPRSHELARGCFGSVSNLAQIGG